MKLFAAERLLGSLGFASCALALSLAGCGAGGPDIASVEGTVKMDGEPLVNAAVVFSSSAGGRPGGGRTDENGHYEINFSGGRKGAIPGENTVTITTLSDPYEDEDGNMVPAQPETVPMKYNSRTELKFTVVDGEKNVADFELDSDGPIAVDETY